MNKKILVTGGSGLVGGYLSKIIPTATYVSSQDFNLTIASEVERMFETYKPDVVVHLAAKVGGLIDNIDYPADYYDDNILMNTNVLKYSKKFEVNRFIGVLSSCAYPDEVKSYPIKESFLHDGPPNKAQFSYGISKRAFAVQIDAYNDQYGTNYQYLIPCNLYGESDKIEESKSHFVTALVRKIYEANENGDDHIVLYGDGTPLRQFMHAKDMAHIIDIAIKFNITDSFNVATEESVSIKEIAKIAIDTTDSSHLSIKFDKNMPNGQIRKDLDVKLMKSLISDYKFVTLQEGIKDFYNFYKQKENDNNK